MILSRRAEPGSSPPTRGRARDGGPPEVSGRLSCFATLYICIIGTGRLRLPRRTRLTASLSPALTASGEPGGTRVYRRAYGTGKHERTHSGSDVYHLACALPLRPEAHEDPLPPSVAGGDDTRGGVGTSVPIAAGAGQEPSPGVRRVQIYRGERKTPKPPSGFSSLGHATAPAFGGEDRTLENFRRRRRRRRVVLRGRGPSPT